MDNNLKNNEFISEETTQDELSKISHLAKDLKQQTFIAISEDKKDFIDIPDFDGVTHSLNHALLGVKPSGGMWGSLPSDELGSASGWHSWCIQEGFGLEKLNYATEFRLKEDAKVITIQSVEDLEILAKTYPDGKEHPMVTDRELTACGVWGNYTFIDWDAVAKDYDAVFVSNYIPIWDLPSISVFHADAIQDFTTESLHDYVRKGESFQDLTLEQIDKGLHLLDQGYTVYHSYTDEVGHHFHLHNGFSIDVCGDNLYVIDNNGEYYYSQKIEYFADIVDSIKDVGMLDKLPEYKEERAYLASSDSVKAVLAEDLHEQSFIAFSSNYKKSVGAGDYGFQSYNYVGDWYEHCMLDGTSPKDAKFVTAFTLKKDARVLNITSEYELLYLSREFAGDEFEVSTKNINWEAVAMRYDAVYINTHTSEFGPKTMIVLRDEAVQDSNCCRLNKFTEMNPPVTLEGFMRTHENIINDENKEMVEMLYKLTKGDAGWDKTCAAFIQHDLKIERLKNGDIIISNDEFTSKIRTHDGASWMDVESPNGNYTIKCHDVKSALANLGKSYGADMKEEYSSFVQECKELRNEARSLLSEDAVATSGDKWSTKFYYDNAYGMTLINDRAYIFEVDENGKEHIIDNRYIENLEDIEKVMDYTKGLEVNNSNDYDYEI